MRPGPVKGQRPQGGRFSPKSEAAAGHRRSRTAVLGPREPPNEGTATDGNGTTHRISGGGGGAHGAPPWETLFQCALWEYGHMGMCLVLPPCT